MIIKKSFFFFFFLIYFTLLENSSYGYNVSDINSKKVFILIKKHKIFEESSYLTTMLEAAIKSGEIILKGFNQINEVAISRKSTNPNDILTDYDKKSEEIILKILQKKFPNFKIIAEETKGGFPKNWNKGYTWAVDPIDGTLNFRYGRKEFAISIALLKDGEPIAGLIYSPARNEIYYAEKNKGAYLNGKKITVRKTPLTNIPLIHFELNKIEDQSFYASLIPISARITQYGGSAALDLAFVASGQVDAQVSTCLSIWDIAAGIIIVSEAGGVVVEPNGKTNFINEGEGTCSLIAGHQEIIIQLLKKLPNITVNNIHFGCD